MEHDWIVERIVPDGDMEAWGARFAGMAVPARRGRGASALGELRRLERRLESMCRAAVSSRENGAAWLLDNFYLVRRGFRAAETELRRTRSLPVLGDGKPRILALGECLASSGDGRVDEPRLRAFLRGFSGAAEPEEGELGLLHAAVTLGLFRTLSRSSGSAERVFRSLHGLAALDTAELRETFSPVEGLLRRDPAGVYARMDRESREGYREQVARLARAGGLTEPETAERALRLAEREKTHVGEYLFSRPLGKPGRKKPLIPFLLACILPALGLTLAVRLGAGSPAAALLALLPLAECSRQLTDRLFGRFCRPRRLPRLDYRQGIPEESRTLAVIVTLLRTPEEAGEAVRRLERFRLANRDAGRGLTFGLLADLRESAQREEETDAAVLEAASAEVRRLNRAYGGGFCLLCRDRTHSERDRVWRGWERKRGAILDLTDLLRNGESRTRLLAGDRSCLERIRFLLVLDGDTELNPGTAARLAGTLAHPMQRPVLDPARRRVVSGCGILQPRVSVSLKDADRSDFARVFAGRGGLDPYGSVNSELYQDLFGEGSYTGKGLLDVDAVRCCLRGRFPPERLLSHDLVEGAFLGCAYAGDIELCEGFPGSVLSYYERQHRWIRGDWQTLPWLGRRVRNEAGEWEKNPIRLLSKWKILDNLRRSLTPAAVFLSLFLYGLLGGRGLGWAAAAGLLSLGLRTIPGAGELLPGRGGHCRARALGAGVSELLQALLLLLLLPYSAWVHLSAAVTALYRMCVSRRRLLQWVTAAESGAGTGRPGAYLRRLFPCTAAGLLGLLGRSPLLLALSLVWLAAPVLAWAVSREKPSGRRVREEDRVFLLHCAGDIWRYFRTFMTAERHWLPPDNLQEVPEEEPAERTSPTNIGLSLLSCAAAWDLGLTDRETAFGLVRRVLDTVETLPRYRGHLYNWYDTRSLQPLQPPYVSTVDSGNLIACLIALAGAAEEAGERDTARRARDLAEAMPLDFLYDPGRKLMHIGWDPAADRAGGGWYDLLESEARIASYIAVARGEAELKHWRQLGRILTGSRGAYGLASWTGTMFEYLMPSLLMPAYPGSLLWESARFCVRRQREDRDRGVWGRSESALDRMDPGFHYCYQAHGTQALALKRGMDRERVVAPYASFLALPWGSGAAADNLRRLRRLGAEGSFGFYEAVDFTPGRCGPEGCGIVRCFMAHHLAMSLLAADNALRGDILHRRFLSDPRMAAYTALLQERGPAGERVRIAPEYRENDRPARGASAGWGLCRRGYSLEEPACFPLTNGRYTVLFSELGCSRSMAGTRLLAVSSFRRFSPGQGILFFADAGRFLSLQPAPEYAPELEYRCEYDGASFVQHARGEGLDFRIETRLARFASGEERRLRVKNRSRESRTLTLGCWFEPALCRPESFAAHPAFSRLSLECRLLEGCLLIRRRPGGREREACCAVSCSAPFEAETDRDALGRGGLQGLPAALRRRGSHVADSENPCVLLRLTLTLKPGESRELSFAFALEDSGERALRALRELRRSGSGDLLARSARAFGMGAGELEKALSLLGPLLYPTHREAARRRELAAWDRGADGLWQYGVSGDLPVAACAPEEAERMLRCWALLHNMGVSFDLAIPVRDEGVYGRPECAALRALAAELGVSGAEGQRGGYHFIGGSREKQKALLARCAVVGIPGFREPKQVRCRPWFLPASAENRELRQGRWEREGYVFTTEKGVGLRTWSHILSTGRMGWLATDTGSGNLFLANAREEPLTPWENDPLALGGPQRLELCRGGEAWSLFADADGFPTEVCFGFGWARWRRRLGQTETEVLAFLPEEARGLALWVRIRGRREGDRVRFRAALAEDRPAEPGLYCCRKPLETWDDLLAAETGGACLSGERCAAGEYAAEDSLILVFGLPEAAGLAEPGEAERALRRVREKWEKLAGAFRLRSPSPALDAYLNGWALYQTLACRILGRSSVYQSGGAYGFRDQLQDVCALCWCRPETARGQILAAASHQYLEGDVMHWWHVLPGGDRGVRTRCSDDLLWLPYGVCVYAETTGDRTILEAEAPWLISPELRETEEDRYEAPARGETDSLLEHCRRAIRLVLRRGTGDHGLLRMGSGDWNDGFDRVRGESVWLSWFAALVLERFGRLTGDEAMRLEARSLAAGAEGSWAGDRYLRGWYEDGRPLGQPGDRECAMDSLSQSFAVLSGFGDPERSRTAVRRAAELLLDREHGLVKLFTPPFDGERDPGYIRSCLPGTRENGGQYTHAAVWLAAACLRCGETELGWRLLETLLPGMKPEDIYQGEPYVLAADVYANADMPGRAGWTWYTGAAGWFLRTAAEELLGLRFRGGELRAQPRLPASWPGYTAELRGEKGLWRAEVSRGPGDPEIRCELRNMGE